MAAIVSVDIRVECARDRGKGGELAAVARRTGKCAYEATSVGVSRCIDARLVNAVVVFDSVYEVGGEDLVTDTRGGVGRALPVVLYKLAQTLVYLNPSS